jgi:hypothetical protein
MYVVAMHPAPISANVVLVSADSLGEGASSEDRRPKDGDLWTESGSYSGL